MSTSADLEYVTELKTWLVDNGAFVHPDMHFEPVAFGFNVVAGNDVPPDSAIVSIPFALAITPDVSANALRALLNESSRTIERWTERQLECTYLCLHWIVGSSETLTLKHRPYINTLPSSAKLRTPLHFTSVELEAFRGSNLYGATLDRRGTWEEEWQQCKTSIASADPEWGEQFTWERYLTASTYISSRAFPSTILSENPSLVTTPTSHPVLLPGIDALNHARAHPVSWVVSSQSDSPPTAESDRSISLVIHTATPKGAELLNNYGPKPNSELILGYGFSLANNPDDTIALKIGGGPSPARPASSPSAGRWEVGRDARGAEPVWEAVVAAVRAQNADEQDGEGGGQEGAIQFEDELCAADMLADMAQSLYDRLPPFPPTHGGEVGENGIRPEVLAMLEHYLEGQRAILQALVAFAWKKQERAIQLAREQGIDILDEQEHSEEEEK